ncbi:MAG TPA: radical SAM protein, partial [Burkholderiales bacterium]|nr:radical SAM protein [Burkholderiales bacterium]
MNARTELSVLPAVEVPLPRFVQIEPVGQCNLRCAMCAIQFREDVPQNRRGAFLPFAEFRRLLDQFGDVGELHLQGLGEPLMHPDFFRMVREAVSRGLKVSTNSNLTLLTEARARECVDSGLDTLHISLDGASATVYES